MALLFLEAIINDFLLHHFRGHYLCSFARLPERIPRHKQVVGHRDLV